MTLTHGMETGLRIKEASAPVHPLGRKARVLLTSVFGPYAQNDEYGSRVINPMELYHNQVTRVQGPFSLRMFHRSWGLMLIQANLEAPCNVLDFPTLARFINELQTVKYDVIGIGAIMPNLAKVAKMCELIRKYQPSAAIVLGGHIANIPDLGARIDADHIARGEGVQWFRSFLGQDPNLPLRHPLINSAIGTRCMGVTVGDRPGDAAAALIPSVGCPMGCNFCCTSAMFGGKGKFVNFFQSGDELFDIMEQLEQSMRVQSFFVMDENFLLQKKRSLKLLELMRKHDKSWSLYVFSSANVLRSYSIEELVGLGVSWVWMGLEGKSSDYTKLKGIDPLTLVRDLQSHGICILGSSIIGLEEHTPDNIAQVIEDAIEYDSEFHQFMLYTPFPGTPLGAEHKSRGTMLDSTEVNEADVHGQLRFNFHHPHIKNGQETQFLLNAFQRDFDVNGPSVLRLARTRLAGWKRYKNSTDSRVRARYRRESRSLGTTLAGALWAAKKWFANNPVLQTKVDAVLRELHREFGATSRLLTPIVGRYIYSCVRSEARRLRAGWTYEPPTFYESNHHNGHLIPMGVVAGR